MPIVLLFIDMLESLLLEMANCPNLVPGLERISSTHLVITVSIFRVLDQTILSFPK